MNNVKISIVIPEYNGGNKIKKCLSKLDDQTFNDFEVLIVDDCSTDDSISEIRDYISNLKNKDKFFLVESDSNGRAGQARNIGVSQAKGDYIIYIDQDDFPDTNLLKELYGKTEFGKIDCVLCDVSDKNGVVYKRPTPTISDNRFVNKKTFIQDCGYVFAILIKKEILNNNHLLFPENVMYEDTLYNCGLFSCVDTINKVDKALYYREDDNTSQTAFLNVRKLSDRFDATVFYLSNYNRVQFKEYLDSINAVGFYYNYISIVWWMICNKKLYEKELFDNCQKWGSKMDVNWDEVRGLIRKRNFNFIKYAILKMVYVCPLSFYLFRLFISPIYSIIKGVKK